MSSRIEQRVKLNAPVSRVWQALTDHRQFGEWFRVRIDGPFVPGEVATGRVTYPGYEDLKWEVTIGKMEPERLFSFTWHPYAVDPDVDYSGEEPTLVEFTLEPAGDGTHLVITETGFDRVPGRRREEAMRMNTQGWGIQSRNIAEYVDAIA